VSEESAHVEEFLRRHGKAAGCPVEALLEAWPGEGPLEEFLHQRGALTRIGLLKLRAVRRGILDLGDVDPSVLREVSLSAISEEPPPEEPADEGPEEPAAGPDEPAAEEPAAEEPDEPAADEAPAGEPPAPEHEGPRTAAESVAELASAPAPGVVDPAAADLVGQSLGGLVLGRALPGDAWRYAAQDGAVGAVVVRVVRDAEPDAAGSPASRFEHATRVARRLAGNGVVSALRSGHAEGYAYLVIAPSSPTTAAEHLARPEPLAPLQAAALARSVCGALSQATRRGLRVHRNLSPAHVYLGTYGVVSLCGWEFAALAREDDAVGREFEELDLAALYGAALPFVAPEVHLSAHLADHRADQYALGVLLFRAATGRHPLEETSARDLVRRQLGEAVDVDPVPEPLRAVVARLLDRDPDARFPSLRKLSAALDEAAGEGKAGGFLGRLRGIFRGGR